MTAPDVSALLKRLGFFYVTERDHGDAIQFHVGHVSSVPFVSVTLDKSTGNLAGPYAQLLNGLAPAIKRYENEVEERHWLPDGPRQAWLDQLAGDAQLSTREFLAIALWRSP